MRAVTNPNRTAGSVWAIQKLWHKARHSNTKLTCQQVPCLHSVLALTPSEEAYPCEHCDIWHLGEWITEVPLTFLLLRWLNAERLKFFCFYAVCLNLLLQFFLHRLCDLCQGFHFYECQNYVFHIPPFVLNCLLCLKRSSMESCTELISHLQQNE